MTICEGQQQIFEVDGVYLSLGQATPEQNNCLIDSLRQVLPFTCIADLSQIRARLRQRYPAGNDAVRIWPPNFLELDWHGEAVLQFLGELNLLGHSVLSFATCRIVSVSLLANGNLETAVHGNGAMTLHIANEGNLHFRPLLPYQGDVSGLSSTRT